MRRPLVLLPHMADECKAILAHRLSQGGDFSVNLILTCDKVLARSEHGA